MNKNAVEVYVSVCKFIFKTVSNCWIVFHSYLLHCALHNLFKKILIQSVDWETASKIIILLSRMLDNLAKMYFAFQMMFKCRCYTLFSVNLTFIPIQINCVHLPIPTSSLSSIAICFCFFLKKTGSGSNWLTLLLIKNVYILLFNV